MSTNPIAQALLAEFEQELTTTRTFIERVPNDKLSYRPHPKSMSAGELVFHIVHVPKGVLEAALPDEFTVPGGDRPQIGSTKEAIAVLDAGAAYVREHLPTISDARMHESLRVLRDGQVLTSMPRVGFLRSIMLNHWYHHRGQLGVYIRLLGASVPSSYGPSGDENPFG